ALGKRELMISLLESDDENTQTNAALTLALLDEKTEKSAEILIKAALNRSGYIAKAGRKYIAPRAISAINALGRVAAKEAVPALYTMIEDESFIEDIPFEPYDFMADRADYCFQYRSHIITSLCDIAKAYPELRTEIKAKLLSYVAGKKLDVTMMGPVIRHDNTATLMKLIENI
nr:hypothetical protein [Clostridia bacterium]